MRVIEVTFERLSDVPINRLFAAIGVYVLWTRRAVYRPTYIGQGYLLDRFSSHAIRFGDVPAGCVAILGYEGPDTPHRVKDEGQIIEHVLLNVSRQIDRFPTQNISGGIGTHVKKVFNRHGVLRVRLKGIDPLRDPTTSSARLMEAKVIELRSGRDGEIEVWHDWNRRPGRR